MEGKKDNSVLRSEKGLVISNGLIDQAVVKVT